MTFSRIYETAGVRRLPVDPVEIARALGIKVVSYKTAAEHFDVLPYEFYPRFPLGFSFREGEKFCIALNENACGEQRRRFTAAHELAHCVLGHFDGETISKYREHDAEYFAAELLAPPVVLHNCGVSTEREIARLCGISRQAAAVGLAQLAERERRGFCPTEDELRTSELFREFTQQFKKCYRKNLYIPIY